MKSVNKKLILALLLTITFGFSQCKEKEEVPELSSSLLEVLSLAQANSINRLNIDWQQLRQDLIQEEQTRGYEDAIRLLLRTLDDNHSFYVFSGWSVSESQVSCSGPAFDLSSLPDDIGYVKVDAFSGSATEGVALANSIQQSIREQDQPGLKGWVLDLSNNLGGNMYPMVAGLGPFFNENTLGYFIDPVGNETSWGYESNGSFVGVESNKVTEVASPYTLQNPEAKVVVITSQRTASSGEATLISFLGRPNTLVLGIASCGLSTANSTFNLSNGHRFVLTVATMADRSMNAYGGRVAPDEEISSSSAMVDRIVEWLGN